MRKQLGQEVVKELVRGQGYKVDKICGVLVTQLEESRPHAVELSHCGTPLRVHTNDRTANQLAKLLAVSFSADELDLDVSRQSETGTFSHWSKLIDRHVVKLSVVLDAGHVSL